MKKGISIYPIEDNLDKYINYIKDAKVNNFDYIFMSLHIPEANQKYFENFEKILQFCFTNNMKVIVDIAKEYFEKFNFKTMNLYGIRLDYGFTISDIKKIAKNNQFKIYLNASTINVEDIQSLLKAKLEMGVFHNFYPKPYSGLSYDDFKKKNEFFKSHNLEILSFACSKFEPRFPLFQGLVTIEAHRNKNSLIQFQELWKLNSDIVCFGDTQASIKEMQLINSSLKNINEDVFIPIKIDHKLTDEERKILFARHKIRPDKSEFLIRSETSRTNFNNLEIKENNVIQDIQDFDLTIDNKNYPRYKNELQIWLKPYLQNNNWTNLICNLKEAQFLLTNTSYKYINFLEIKD
ncbi:MupG family TIM beta-alpha barrel fold protein [Spiroplasma endosymbiont of Crioceris asparagi]|uniref:MupG family TIM beta-alpha barrel fold protein n=1 Tax=Spiroplasma endosymbiont of Crioceris asparagi TaxID=3066286 RepID=UPI0030D4C40E